MNNKDTIISIFIILVLISGIYTGYVPFFIFVLVLFFMIIRTETDSVGVFLLLFGGPLGGVLRTYYPFLPVYGLLLNLIGLILLRGYFKGFFYEGRPGLRSMAFVCIVFLFSLLQGDCSEYAVTKMVKIVTNGFLMIFAYYCFCKSRNIVNSRLGVLLILSSILYVSFILNYYSFDIGNILDYNWFREVLMQYSYSNDEETLIGYQQVGMMALFGIAIIFSNVKINMVSTTILAIFAFQIILMSGARLAIFGFVIIVFLRFVFFNQQNRSKKVLYYILLGGICVTILLGIIVKYGGERNVSLLETGESDRDLIFLDAIRIFMESPLLGVGLGGFASHTIIPNIAWPHNLFLELLCETGIVGTLLLVIIVGMYVFRNRIGLRLLSNHGSFYFIVLIVLFLRVMISSDLSESIELFSAVFALSNTHKSYEPNSRNHVELLYSPQTEMLDNINKHG